MRNLENLSLVLGIIILKNPKHKNNKITELKKYYKNCITMKIADWLIKVLQVFNENFQNRFGHVKNVLELKILKIASVTKVTGHM